MRNDAATAAGPSHAQPPRLKIYPSRDGQQVFFQMIDGDDNTVISMDPLAAYTASEDLAIAAKIAALRSQR